MSPPGSVTQLLQRVRGGDRAALAPLLQRYYPHVLRRVAARRYPTLERVATREDVAHAVMLAVHRRLLRAGAAPLNNRDDLVHLLNCVTHRKAIDLLRGELRRKRGGDWTRCDAAPDDLAEPALTPEERVLQEEWCRFLVERLSPELRAVARLLLDGHDRADVAAALGCCLRTVDRKIARIREQILDDLGGDAPSTA